MSVTIEDVMAIAERACAHSRNKSTQWCADETIHQELRAALLALVAQARDEEAEACAALCAKEIELRGDAYQCEHNIRHRIRARIAGRKA